MTIFTPDVLSPLKQIQSYISYNFVIYTYFIQLKYTAVQSNAPYTKINWQL